MSPFADILKLTGLRQQDAADRADVSKPTVTNWCGGAVTPSLSAVTELQKILQDIDALTWQVAALVGEQEKLWKEDPAYWPVIAKKDLIRAGTLPDGAYDMAFARALASCPAAFLVRLSYR